MAKPARKRPKPESASPVVSTGPSALETPLAKLVLESLEDAKAEDIVAIDLMGRTSIADVMVVASGRSNTHVGAIADRVLRACREKGHKIPRVEGMPHNDWVLLDAGDAIVHIFRPDVRQFYNLEKMWGADRPAEERAAHPG